MPAKCENTLDFSHSDWASQAPVIRGWEPAGGEKDLRKKKKDQKMQRMGCVGCIYQHG